MKRIAILVVAYDAVTTLEDTLRRIPSEVMEKAEEIIVIDDCSNDNTYYAALGYKLAPGGARNETRSPEVC
ncbi:MAG: glycosyltransferase [Acidobacteriota bacterium]